MNRWTYLALASISITGCLGGAPSGGSGEGSTVTRRSAVTSCLPAGDVMGFETPSAWSITSGTLSVSERAVEGDAALAVSGISNGYMLLTSAKVCGPVFTSSKLAVSLYLPPEQSNPSWFGDVQLYVEAPSRNIWNRWIGWIGLTGRATSQFHTLAFDVPADLRQALAGNIDDLVFKIALNVPGGSAGTYVLDNLSFPGAVRVDTGPVPPVLERDPVAFSQETWNVSHTDMVETNERLFLRGYMPVSVSSTISSGDLRLSAVYHKDKDLVNFATRHFLTAAELQAFDATLRADNFQVVAIDAHDGGDGQPRFTVTWHKRTTPAPAYNLILQDTSAMMTARLTAIPTGFRPLKISGYQVGSQTFFASIWVSDGKEAAASIDLSGDAYHTRWSQLRDLGFHPSDISGYGSGIPKFAGVWVRGDGVTAWTSNRNLTSSELRDKMILMKDDNKRLIDLDQYTVTAAGVSTQLYSAIWVQTEPRHVLASDLDTADPALAPLRQAAVSYLEKASLGFFVEDLTNGHFVAFNPDEPFYLASMIKVFVAGRTITTPGFDPNTTVPFNAADWRGENDRGFTRDDLGTMVSLDRFLRNMIDNSDTASADLLYGRAVTNFGPRAVNDFITHDLGLFNFDDITTICDVDKRIRSGSSCVQDMRCACFEGLLRGAPPANCNNAEIECAFLHGGLEQTSFDAYFETLVNSMTPRTFAQFWRRLGSGGVMAGPGQRGHLLRYLHLNGNHQPAGGPWDAYGGKGGAKDDSKSWSAVSWRWTGTPGDYNAVAPQFSFTVLTEDRARLLFLPLSSDADADQVIDDVLRLATQYLVSKR
jgi:hypothetical protein